MHPDTAPIASGQTGRHCGCMAVTGVLAQATVSDLSRAESWYSEVLGRAPDERPMPGLLQWLVGADAGLQVWQESERAGRSSIVLAEDDLDAVSGRLLTAGIEHAGPEAGGGARILQLTDPDGNRVVLTGS